MDHKSDDLFYLIREEKMEKTKARKEVIGRTGRIITDKHNSSIISLLIKRQLRLQVMVWVGLVL